MVKKRAVRRIVILSVGGIFFFAAVVAPFLAPAARAEKQLWSGYAMLLVAGDHSESDVLERLTLVGYDDVRAPSSTYATYNDFGALARIAVADLPERFSQHDPRYDPYLRGLPMFFTAYDGVQTHAVYYVATDDHPFRVHQNIRRALSGVTTKWFLVEWSFDDGIVYVGAFALMLIALAVGGVRRRVLIGFGGIPCLSAVFMGGAYTFVLVGVAFFAWALVIDRGFPALEHRIRYGRRAAPDGRGARFIYAAVALPAVVGYVARRSPAAVTSIIPPIIGLIAVSIVVAVLIERKLHNEEHRVFAPVPILTGTRYARPVSGLSGAAVAAIFLVLLATPLAHGFILPSRTVAFPQPVSYTGASELSFSGIGALARYRAADALPDLSDYLAHRAFHDGFMYARSFDVPTAGETVTVAVYERRGESVERTEYTPIVYDEAWLASVLTRDRGMHDVLLDQNTPNGVVVRQSPTIYWPRSHQIGHTALMILLFSPFPAGSLGMVSHVRVRIEGSTVRRKRQAA